ncbi:unnamed protein product [Spirodela intermedia]|uniref:Uncharacterized protein n=1 Tax=Spirodela intermedia TaxID=51605 RepID=A0A7I8IUI4_SPIIN|nr:unnamed protein product [Spirodela intermedia]CAA6660627.1 unnamed protein product [Spirodela intermedia]
MLICNVEYLIRGSSCTKFMRCGYNLNSLYLVFILNSLTPTPDDRIAAMESSRVLSSPARRLEGKVAIVTGGASGIGESTARLFADEKGQEVCREIVGDGGVASYIHCDVSAEADVQATVEIALRSHGRLDIMFNNAGTIVEYRPLIDIDRSDFEKVIINTASSASVMAAMTVSPYTASKHAVVGLTRDAAVELGRCGVRVNCVSPHLLASPLACRALGMDTRAVEDAVEKSSVLSAAVLKAQDIAEAVLYLASDESRYVNGHNLVVDGGYTTTNPSLGHTSLPHPDLIRLPLPFNLPNPSV